MSAALVPLSNQILLLFVLLLSLQWAQESMKKIDRVRDLLLEGYRPREVAERVPCSLSLVYEVRGKCDLVRLRHEVAELRLTVGNLYDRMARLEGKPINIMERFQQQRHA